MDTSNVQAQAHNRRSAAVFGTFHLEQSEFTLPVEAVQEVVNYPAQITVVPLAPDFLSGIFNLRGSIIPVINLKKLLSFSDTKTPVHSKIAIVDLMGAKVGLIFDSTGEILHVQEDQKSEFSYDDRPGHRAVKGALKLDGGNRIVQILDPEALLKIENLPQIIDRISKKNPRLDREANARGPRRQCISFLAGKTKLALDIETIREIIKVPEMQDSIIASENCLGTLNLRGELMPVIDFVKLLGFRAEAARTMENERVIVVRIAESSVGLLIDSVDNIVSFYKDEVLPIPLFNQEKSDLFSGLISRENGQDMILLDGNGVLNIQELKASAEGHVKLFKSGLSNHVQSKKTAKGQRRVCIAFQLERAFALPIHEIQEIINYSNDTLKPPGLPSQIRGVLNLRGKAITIVDMRVLYGLSPFGDLAKTKVLIVDKNGSKFSLLVDSVEDIVAYFDDQKMDLPRALLGESTDTFQSEVKEFIEVENGISHEKRSLMILDLEKVLARIETLLTAS